MASFPTRTSLSEDWQEVAETGSIKSLPSEPALSRSPSPPQLPPPPSAAHHEPPVSSYVSMDEALQKELAVQFKDDDEIICENEPANDSAEQQRSEASQDSRVQTEVEQQPRHDDAHDTDSPAINVDDSSNPETYRITLFALDDHLEEVIKFCSKGDLAEVQTLLLMRLTCVELLSQVRELAQMVDWAINAGSRSGSEPASSSAQAAVLDPNLLEWASGVSCQLLRAQTQFCILGVSRDGDIGQQRDEMVRIAVRRTPTSPSAPSHWSAVAKCIQELERSYDVIQDFLPIIKADYDEARSREMVIPKYNRNETPSPHTLNPPPSVHNGGHDNPSPFMVELRRSLYDLKDKIRTMSVFLDSFSDREMYTVMQNVRAAAKRLDAIGEAITVILTNHASEWIEHDLGGRAARTVMSHVEYQNLDPTLISELTDHLYQMIKESDYPKGRWPDTITYTDGMIRNHRVAFFVEVGRLKEVLATVELLEMLFGVSHAA